MRATTKSPPVVVAPVEPVTVKVFFVRVDDARFTAEADGFIAEKNAADDGTRMSRGSLIKVAVRAYIRAARANV